MKNILSDADISLNLSKVIESTGMSQTAFAAMINVPKSNLTDFLSGKRRAENLLAKLITIGVNGSWYLTGEGPMFMKDLQRKGETDGESEEALRGEAKKIQMLINRGWIQMTSKPIMTHEMQDIMLNEPESLYSAGSTFDVPHYTHRIAAGIPVDSSGTSEIIALPKLLVRHPKETYAVTVTGDSMIGAGIDECDILIVDKAIEPKHDSIVIASINGEQTVKRLIIESGTVSLAPENHHYQITTIIPEMDFRILGVVTWVIRKTA